ncbi:MAG TPA: flavodoxin domain-containing protein, partial [Gemmatimonadaceae bacterium]|nr:flavodoxin domain-containing protein [Gemmatimonadaceae bacterium]
MRVLVSVASKHGATDEIGHAVAGALREAGVDAVEVDPAQVTGVEPYDAVILGSAVYAGRWMEPVKQLIA